MNEDEDLNFLPPDVSLDHAMTADNLFYVWYTSTRFQRSLGAPPVHHLVLLCDPGPDLLDRLHRRSGKMIPLLAVSVRDFPELVARLRGPLGRHGRARMVYNPGEEVRWSRRRDGKVMHATSLGELEKLCAEGQAIVRDLNYRRVFGDARPESEGRPWDWLLFMKDSILGHQMRRRKTERGRVSACVNEDHGW